MGGRRVKATIAVLKRGSRGGARGGARGEGREGREQEDRLAKRQRQEGGVTQTRHGKIPAGGFAQLSQASTKAEAESSTRLA